ncbi:MAG TPA: o-succinylbenzoate--CoA ligase [Chlorobaculum sp.]|uniref:O-succinylbenzoic acid--CoA ligase n=1 Tax=Chlorobaculum tepidum (strain ATCC 49652 / DSM 12025 / NBRC 103806 / TLS) TaxID=194439 RepID=Q8KBE0_CHLTE|nr:o-succinylbenzoate--CoA ligase [Chlorobaculum tepidum]AAM73068.1 o-succinylbenzoic acid--CoA ligase [Chlorobaculum tepidum TLS]HBU24199.1 o-succinylbenzoate--CoA ligase [Chlorobaculum sp.]
MELVTQAAQTFGDQPALITDERRWSFADLDGDTARIATAFEASSIRRGDIVALVAPNSPALVLSLMALMRMGAVAAPVNHRFPANHIEGVLARLNPAMTLDAAKLDAFVADAIARTGATFTAATEMERPVSVIHTSASSGKPKAAVHSLSNHYHSAMGSAQNLPFGPGDCWLLSLPLYHVGGYSMLFKCLLGGGALAVPSPDAALAESLTHFPVTHLSLVPTQLYRMLRADGGPERLRSLRALLLGGSAVSAPLLREAICERVPLYLTYGSTEMSTQVTTSPTPVTKARGDSGVVLPYREVAISVDGEILVKGECLFMGYLDNGELREARDKNGWFHTGDMGELSGDARLTVLGRKDNMFISGGENIHPEEIEKALTSIVGIEEAVVVPAPDAEYGMRPVAWIKARSDSPDDATIIASLKSTIGKLKTPVAFHRIQEWQTIPGSAKIDRSWYRKLAEK